MHQSRATRRPAADGHRLRLQNAGVIVETEGVINATVSALPTL
jgi:hypothetical protein